MYRALPLALLAMACTRNSLDADSYRPSMTQLRIGEVVVDEPPVIPEDEFVPGIVVAPEDVSYNERRPQPGYAYLSDYSHMKEIENPTALDKHAETYSYGLQPGTLFDEDDDLGLDFEDVHQGSIADCYLAGAMSSVVYADADHAVIDGLVREFDDDKGNLSHYVVRFYDAWGEPQDIEVDAQLIRRSNKPLYMRSGDSSSSAEELWPGIVEKAYAKWHGDYEKIGNGGFGGDALQALTGAQANWKRITRLSESSLHRSIRDAVDANRPIVAGTHGEDSGVDYAGTGVYAWHIYSVLDSEEVTEGEDAGTFRVQLRNPWGSTEPADNGPDDGIFWMSYRDFYRLYSNVTFGGSYSRDVTAPSAVSDLEVIRVGDDVSVRFTTTGDDATSGLAHGYDLRVLQGEISDASWADAERVETVDPQAPNTKVTLPIHTLEAGSYTVAVRMADESGNLSALSNTGRIEIGSGAPPPQPTDPYWPFSDGDGGWSATGDWVYTGDTWYLGDPSTNSYDLGRQVQGRLESPEVDLSAFPTPYLIWDHILDVESGSEYDQAWVEMSNDGFVTSTRIWEKVTTGDATALEFAYIESMADETVQFAFVFDSIDEQENNGVGWKISTVLVDSD